jgi:hypothetical protein
MAPRETRERFSPRPFVVEPSETLFSLKGAKELHLSSLHARKKWKWFLWRRPARLSSPGVNAGAFRRDLVKGQRLISHTEEIILVKELLQ